MCQFKRHDQLITLGVYLSFEWHEDFNFRFKTKKKILGSPFKLELMGDKSNTRPQGSRSRGSVTEFSALIIRWYLSQFLTSYLCHRVSTLYTIFNITIKFTPLSNEPKNRFCFRQPWCDFCTYLCNLYILSHDLPAIIQFEWMKNFFIATSLINSTQL